MKLEVEDADRSDALSLTFYCSFSQSMEPPSPGMKLIYIATGKEFNHQIDISAACAGYIEIRQKVADLRKEVDILKAKDRTLTLREVCLSLERFITFELLGADAKREERHQFVLLNRREKDQLELFLDSCGMNRKLFKILKEFGNDNAHVDRPSISAKELEAMIKDENDYQKAKERKRQFLIALQKYKIIRSDGTVDVTAKPAFT
jgi:hypothetical protein